MPAKTQKGKRTEADYRQIANAAGLDAGNRRMRQFGRKVWNQRDYNAATRELVRILREMGIKPY